MLSKIQIAICEAEVKWKNEIIKHIKRFSIGHTYYEEPTPVWNQTVMIPANTEKEMAFSALSTAGTSGVDYTIKVSKQEED